MDMNMLVDNINKNVPIPEKEYLGEDGYLYCQECNERVQTDIEVFGRTKRVRCICSCIQKERDSIAEREKQESIRRAKMVCFHEPNMTRWTFESDDRKNPKLSDAMQKYVENFQEFKAEGKGLLLYGSVGTGKTFYAACIANRLMDDGKRCLMRKFSEIINTLQGMYDGKQEYIDSLNRYDLLILDDLGAERNTEYMIEQVFTIIDARYRAGKPFIVTTNLTADELKKPQEIGYTRIYDRILEKCHPVNVDGYSRRRLKVKEEYQGMKDKLGL